MNTTKTRRSTVKQKPRVVFDSNIYIAYMLSKNPRSPNRELFQLLESKKYELLWCDAIRKEAANKLIDKAIPIGKITEFLADLYLLAKEVHLSSTAIPKIITADPDDDFDFCSNAKPAFFRLSRNQKSPFLSPGFPCATAVNPIPKSKKAKPISLIPEKIPSRLSHFCSKC